MNIISPKLLSVRRIRAALICCIGIIIILFFWGISYFSVMMTFILTGLLCIDEWLLLPKQCGTFFCSLDNNGIIFQKGLLFRKYIVIPYQSIRFCRMIRTPCENWFGITDIKLYCEGASETIPALTLRNSVLIQRHCLQLQRSYLIEKNKSVQTYAPHFSN